MAKKWSFGGLFRSFTGKNNEEELKQPSAADGKQSEPGDITAENRPQTLDDAAWLPDIGGSLLEVWHKWEDGRLPPVLSLETGKTEEELTACEKKALERECVRLSLQLEQDAKKRLNAIQKAEKEGTSLDVACRIYLSRDKMAAWSFIFPPFNTDGKLLGEAVGKALEQSGVTTGIDSTALAGIFHQPQYFKLTLIAAGIPVVEGADGSVTECYPRQIAMEVKLDENGVADYRALNYVQLIEKDAVICDITPPQEGKAGIRVDGKVVEPKPAKPARVPAGKNTALTEDGLHLIATRDGHLEFSNDAFHVRPLLEIPGDVDYSTGNIDFPGDVHIRGDVRENFTVQAAGTITVDGLVEAATVEAGGDLVITRGVVGDNRALLKSKGCVRVRYLENCVVYAGKCVYADCIMTSQIFSDDAISVVSGRGSVIGGALTAANSIRARMIGAQSGRRTELTLGVLPYVQNELHNMEEDLLAIARESKNLEKELTYLENKQGLEGSSEKLAKARMRQSVLKMKQQMLLKRKERMTSMTPDLSGCWIECDVIYPITSLTVQDANWVANNVRKHCRVVYDEKTGELKEKY